MAFWISLLESDADLVVATASEGGPFSCAGDNHCSDSQIHPLKSRITAAPEPSGVLQAEPFSFAATKIRIGRGPRCRYGRCRRNNSLLRQRKLESDADLVAATTDAGGPFLTAAAMTLHRFPSLALKSRIDARKRLFSGKSLHRFSSLALKSRIDARKRA